jgi:uncharacterized protein YbjT (DUF2867 family)
MPEPETPPFAVIGATGQQGGAVVDALLAAGHPVRALVRDPDSAKSRALAHRQVTPVHADQDDADSMVAALDGVAALFMMTTFAGPKGTEGEIEHGRAIADAAVRAGVPRVAPGSWDQTWARTFALALSIRFAAAGVTSSRARHTVGADATGPKTSPCWRSTSMSAMASPPPGSGPPRPPGPDPGRAWG